MTRHYYAIQYCYGAHTTGDTADRLRRFTAKANRDAWVSRGNSYSTQPGAREALRSSDTRVRSTTEEQWTYNDELWTEEEYR